MGPTNVTVPSTPLTGSFNVTICANPSTVCQEPVAPSLTVHTEVVVYVQVGDQTYAETVPVGVGVG